MEGFWSGSEENSKKGLEGTGLNQPVNRHGNLKSASSDQNLKEILQNIRSSKSPTMINYGASWCHICSQILPSYCRLSDEFQKLSFVYADID
ncbi:thioredoxin-like 3-3 isoform X1 [Telopea speciosissima]|uniref:thioredoxin-like 3-3 isoform X1 n=1 Tax=Telopea speciosissima TaxID=54955 RepID=UPI001CC6E10F|nr:thioredoxin-like 3-3 isoform X1 [Telopea speciosissima]